MKPLTYRDAGVDIDEGDNLVDRIKKHGHSTRTNLVLGDLGGFAGLCRLPEGIVDPVLVSGTDGVGTKLKLAFAWDGHDTVGQDLVAMCVNDVVTTGARPLFFLDLFRHWQAARRRRRARRRRNREGLQNLRNGTAWRRNRRDAGDVRGGRV